jgi:hypothetical protein
MIRDVDELQVLYVLYVINVLPAARNAGRQKLHQQETFIRFLSTVPTSERLAKCIIDVLDQVEDWKPAEMAKAFEGLESFALNLLDFPWKKEFRTILVSYASRCRFK